MPTIDVSDIVNDSDLAQSFTVLRSMGSFGVGGWNNLTTTIPMYGTITPAEPQDLQQVPEGDRITGAIAIYSQQQLFRTRVGQTTGLSDIVIWQSEQYRIASVTPFLDFGYWQAIALRLAGS